MNAITYPCDGANAKHSAMTPVIVSKLNTERSVIDKRNVQITPSDIWRGNTATV